MLGGAEPKIQPLKKEVRSTCFCWFYNEYCCMIDFLDKTCHTIDRMMNYAYFLFLEIKELHMKRQLGGATKNREAS